MLLFVSFMNNYISIHINVLPWAVPHSLFALLLHIFAVDGMNNTVFVLKLYGHVFFEHSVVDFIKSSLALYTYIVSENHGLGKPQGLISFS